MLRGYFLEYLPITCYQPLLMVGMTSFVSTDICLNASYFLAMNVIFHMDDPIRGGPLSFWVFLSNSNLNRQFMF